MRVRRLTIKNFRGVSEGVVDFVDHTLLVGGNNVGKSTVCEALDLVLGAERMYRRPVVDEHDFHAGRYLDDGGDPVNINISAVLLDLSAEAQRRFFNHLRPWDETKGDFLDRGADGVPTEATTTWALPVVFVGHYDKKEDDFVGNTFFEHPDTPPDEDDPDPDAEAKLGGGKRWFSREHKRLCGFIYLRALRTGARALSLERGSLLDTVLRLRDGELAEMWTDTLAALRDLNPAIGELAQLKSVREELRKRMSQFVKLAPGDDATAFFASDLTRQHLREVVRLFVSSQPGNHLVPFEHLGTGALNLLVFALLTFIAELKTKQSVIFAMEEPEIALPPHTQRRVVGFALREMGQTIVTSHSPYVIEQFAPAQIVMIDRQPDGKLSGRPVKLDGVKPKVYRDQQRQFAEAVLARGVLVVEGSTEAALFPAASTVMERGLGSDNYEHIDLAGVSIFNAGSDAEVPKFGPVFAGLGKQAFAVYDKRNGTVPADQVTKLNTYKKTWELPVKGIEALLANETAVAALRRFLAEAASRSDYPVSAGKPTEGMTDDAVRGLAQKVLMERKGAGYGYGAILIEQCGGADELPATIRTILTTINESLGTGPASPQGALI